MLPAVSNFHAEFAHREPQHLSGGPADRDQALVRALTYGALRWHHRHRLILDEMLVKLARDTVLMLALNGASMYFVGASGLSIALGELGASAQVSMLALMAAPIGLNSYRYYVCRQDSTADCYQERTNLRTAHHLLS